MSDVCTTLLIVRIKHGTQCWQRGLKLTSSATNIELVGRSELQLLAQRIRRAGAHPVEDVIVALLVVL